MEDKKKRPSNSTITRNIYKFSNMTDNFYETVAMLSKRANQISIDVKKEMHKKIEEFTSNMDSLDEIYENREQIELVRHYEQMPKPTLVATSEYLNGELYYRNPAKEDTEAQRLEALENETIAKNSEQPAEKPAEK